MLFYIIFLKIPPPPLQPIAEIERKTTLTSDAHLIVKIGQQKIERYKNKYLMIYLKYLPRKANIIYQ